MAGIGDGYVNVSAIIILSLRCMGIGYALEEPHNVKYARIRLGRKIGLGRRMHYGVVVYPSVSIVHSSMKSSRRKSASVMVANVSFVARKKAEFAIMSTM
jgi:hypothetical protein